MFEFSIFVANRVTHFICLFGAVAAAVPTIAFPINSQVPPVGRVSTPFTFTFATSTFSSSSSMNYTLTNAPIWLNFNELTRTLSGIPPINAANTAPIIQITASDDSGSVTMNTTLVISDHPAPVVVIPLLAQLSALGEYSPPLSILYHPSTPFKFSFDPGTFDHSNLSHYAITSENTPLPAWIAFNGATLSFSGRTPNSSSLIQPPQTWDLQLIASDVLGFAGAAINFNVVVGNHDFKFTDGLLSVNATTGVPIEFKGLSGSLILDGKKASISELASIEVSAPDWLVFDNTTFRLSGTPPVGATSYNVSVMVADIYQDIANATIKVLVSEGSIFVGPAGPFNVTIGNPFRFNLSSSFLNASDIIASVETALPATWLAFNNQEFILSGIVPPDIQPTTLRATLKAVSKSRDVSDIQNFTLNVMSRSIQVLSPTQTIPLSTATATSTETINTAASDAIHAKKLSGGQVAAIVIALVLAFIIALLLWLFYHRRRKHRERQKGAFRKDNISRPIMTPPRGEEQAGTQDRRVISSDTPIITDIHSRHRPSTLKRQLQSVSSIRDEMSMYLRDSRSSGIRGRSYSENALSELRSSWRYTQDSAYPRLPIASVRNSAIRTTQNFSRKSSGLLPREGIQPRPFVESKTKIQTTKPSRSSIQKTPDVAYEPEAIKEERLSRTRTPNYLGFPDMGRRLSGLGHGLHTATPPSMVVPNWYIGEFDLAASEQKHMLQNYSLDRDNPSWLTIPGDANGNEQHRHSALSVLTESTELLKSPRRVTVRQVPKSPSQSSSRLSLTGRFSRAGSRRLMGSSPFFAGSSRASSRRTSRKSTKITGNKYLYSRPAPINCIGPTNNTLHSVITHGLRDSESSLQDLGTMSLQGRQTDPLGVTFSSTGEGTRKLREYVRRLSSHLSTSSRNSMQFSETDSRFRSAESSPGLQHYKKSSGQEEDHVFRYSHYGYTDNNSPCSFNKDIYGVDGSPQLSEAIGAQAVTRPGVVLPGTGNLRLKETNSRAEFMEGRCMPSLGTPAGSYEHGMVREKSLSTSRFGGVSDDEADVSPHRAFL